ncbi:bifunctional protein-serine/threonine kinase/phosphatase [Pelagicoccus sp. SDUM812002]|uniref:bifunctional protein-serine/threonine kinase/phosphatase n=1 Tax=Pelagicoccus sp. SDUM812002 TaxID=3041266 RepID=UPI00280CE563|nr:bifunctional protein-serine/threonine kinase/phosphatase [Pelagicoccus sp. SDUM812002]MDQ8187167.1 bifunctional protein-serine/threonine kinase/phosphatase [Pelagicoccus sp. SDUM812002]
MPLRDMPLEFALKIEAGMSSDAGPNEQNDDCLGVRVPEGIELITKGIAAVIADGVSAAEHGKQAAEICVQGFLNDYYDAPEAWTVATCGNKVFQSLNRWLYGLGRSNSRDGRGYVTTMTSLVFKGGSVHIFHVGDTRIYRLRGDDFEQLTRDHSFSYGRGGTGLARAMGMDTGLDVETSNLPVEEGDRYLLTTDGIHGFLTDAVLKSSVEAAEKEGFDLACGELCRKALAANSNDNCSAILIEVLGIGAASKREHQRHFKRLPFPPDLAPGMKMDGYEIEEELQATSRSQTYIAREAESGRLVVIKTPSVTFEDDTGYIERFIMEGWIGKKLKHERLARAFAPPHGQNFLYTVLEYIEGQSLEQWIRENPTPDVRRVTTMAREILQGLRAMHRMEMLHQDLKPSNIILHPERGAVIIDYGSTHVAGLQEINAFSLGGHALGTLGYSAPEYFLEKKPSRMSDMFSLGVIVYEMLTGKLPYGERYERCQSVRDFSVLEYQPATKYNSHVPVWLDGALRKAVAINPHLRYESYSEFEYDIEHPNPKFLPENAGPFIERNPVLFWKIVAGALLAAEVATLLWFLR